MNSNPSTSTTLTNRIVPITIQASLWIALSGILYGIMSYFGIQIINSHFSVPAMLFWRFFIATLWMIAWSAWKEPQFLQQLPNLRTSLAPILIGAILYGAGSSLYFFATQRIGTGLAMVIFFSYPMFIAIFLLFKNKGKMNRLTLISLSAILIGLILLKQNDARPIQFAGIVLGIISAFFYALYIFKCNKARGAMSSNYFTILICIGCTLMLLFITTLTHTFTWPTTFKSLSYIAAISIFSTAIPIQLMLEGLKHVSPLKAGIISVLEPVVTVIVGILLLNEIISPIQTLGITLLLLGAILIQFARE